MTTITKQDLIDLLPIAARHVSWPGITTPPQAPWVCPVCALVRELDPTFQYNALFDYAIRWFEKQGIDAAKAIRAVVAEADATHVNSALRKACA